MKISVINHDIRKTLGLTCLQYLVLDTVYQLLDPSPEEIAGALGVSITNVEQVLCTLAEYDLLIKSEHDNCYTIDTNTRRQISGIDQVVPRKKKAKKESEYAEAVINLFNQVNGTRYNHRTYAKEIDAIFKHDKNVTMQHIESVIKHKRLTWGEDDNMKQHNNPTTIFRNAPRFMKYIDDARTYWLNKVKEESYVDLGR